MRTLSCVHTNHCTHNQTVCESMSAPCWCGCARNYLCVWISLCISTHLFIIFMCDASQKFRSDCSNARQRHAFIWWPFQMVPVDCCSVYVFPTVSIELMSVVALMLNERMAQNASQNRHRIKIMLFNEYIAYSRCVTFNADMPLSSSSSAHSIYSVAHCEWLYASKRISFQISLKFAVEHRFLNSRKVVD